MSPVFPSRSRFLALPGSQGKSCFRRTVIESKVSEFFDQRLGQLKPETMNDKR